MGTRQKVVERQVSFEETIRFEDFPVLNESENILVLVDEAQRRDFGRRRLAETDSIG